MTVLATYIMAKVKLGVDGCGGSTHFVAMRKGGDIALSENAILDALEKELLDLERLGDQSFVKAMLEKKVSLKWINKIAVSRNILETALEMPSKAELRKRLDSTPSGSQKSEPEK